MENDHLIKRINKLEDRAFQLRLAISGLSGAVRAMERLSEDKNAKQDLGSVKVRLEKALELFD
jgi:hypothetical protein